MRILKKSCKKGSFFDVLGILVTAIVIIAFALAIGIAQKETGDALTEAKAYIDTPSFNESADVVIDQADKYPAFWDFLIAFLIFAVFIVAFISAFILGNNPIFFGIYIVLSIANLVVATVLELGLEEIMTNAVLSTYTSSYPITLFIVNHYFLFALFFIIAIAVALYMKPGGQQ